MYHRPRSFAIGLALLAFASAALAAEPTVVAPAAPFFLQLGIVALVTGKVLSLFAFVTALFYTNPLLGAAVILGTVALTWFAVKGMYGMLGRMSYALFQRRRFA